MLPPFFIRELMGTSKRAFERFGMAANAEPADQAASAFSSDPPKANSVKNYRSDVTI